MDPGSPKGSLGSLGEVLGTAWVLRWAPWEVLGGGLWVLPGLPWEARRARKGGKVTKKDRKSEKNKESH